MKKCLMLKRILVAAVLCLLILSLAACGSKSKKTKTPTVTPSTTAPTTTASASATTAPATTAPATTAPATTAPATTAPATTAPATTAPTSFAISFDADATQGSVSGYLPDLMRSIESGALVERGTTVTLTATANEGFTFAGWFRGDEAVSDVTPFSFTVENDPIALTAHFDMMPSFGTETTPIEGDDGSWELNGD